MKINELKAVMMKQKLSVSDLAKMLEISRSSLNRRMNGSIDFKFSEVDKIVKILGLSKEEYLRIFFD